MSAIEKNPHRWFIIAAVMLSTVMEILDTTIVTVSLPHMMGSLGADRDQISWVLTSYIVAAGMLMPLTGFLVHRLGCKRLLLINIAGFLAASALCGLSGSLGQIVCFRLLQGLFGASLVPLSQFILRDSFPAEDQPKVMAIWGIGVMAAPIMGPTLGGYITDALNWRWVFYINVPICIINFYLVVRYIKQSPITKIAIDWMGIVLMLTCIGSLQLFLDRGEIDDWFASSTICWLFSTFVISGVWFLRHSFKVKNPIINLRLFMDRNFAVGTLMMGFFAASFLGCMALIPQMLETLFGYSSDLTGMTMAPRGIASGLMMAVCSQLLARNIDARWLIITGLGIGVYTTWLFGGITLNTGISYITWLGFFQGLGIGFFFMPLSTIIYSTLPKSSVAEAAGLFSFGRNIGNAIGVSLFTTYLDRETQTNWNVFGSHIQTAGSRLAHWLAAQHLKLHDPHTITKLSAELGTQANFVAYMHTFKLSALVLFLALLMIFLLKPIKQKNLVLADAH